MPGARYLPINLIDRPTTVLTSGQLLTPNLPLENLKLQARETVTRLNVPSISAIAVDFPAAVSANCVAMCSHNLSVIGTFSVRLYSAPALSGLLYDSGDLAAFPSGLSSTVESVDRSEFQIFRNRAIYFPLRNDIRSAAVFIKDPASASGYLELARLCMGVYKEFKYQDPYGGATLAVESLTSNERSKSGAMISNKGANFSRIEIKKEWIEDAEWTDMIAAYTRLGLDMDFFYSQFPNDGAMTIEEFYYQGMKKFGQMSAVDKWVYGLNRTSFTLEGQ